MTAENDETKAADAVFHEPDQAAATTTPEDELQRLRDELADAKDRELRARAELENFRKRARREMEDERRYACQPLLADLLPVVDDVGRAIAAGEKSPEAANMVAGFKLVAQQLEGVLAKNHCTRIAALHEPFDPHRHAAISQQAASEHPAGTVLLVAQEGYQLHDRVLRPSQVIVSTAPPG